MSKRILLFTLQTFSTTGGIQKMTRTLSHSLHQIALRNKWSFELWSAYDKDHDLMNRYLPAEYFKGFKANRALFVLKTLHAALKSDVIILSHINLAVVGLIIKLINPACKVWLVAHGIEVWRPLSLSKRLLLNRCDKILCVSNFTKQRIIDLHKTNPAICYVLNNAIDPFIKLPVTFTKPEKLLKRYGLDKHAPIIFTLTRLASTEQYKGYEQVIKVIAKLKLNFPDITYILSGQYDAKEEIRIKTLIAVNKVEKQVILTGFIDENELTDYFLFADLFVLPSKKEGFGIVFIEALACGLPVICGNADGSIDAIRNGELGEAINVEDLAELESSITKFLNTPLTIAKREYLQQQCLLYFNEQNYINDLQQLLSNDRTN